MERINYDKTKEVLLLLHRHLAVINSKTIVSFWKIIAVDFSGRCATILVSNIWIR